jgi:hypothetical protein
MGLPKTGVKGVSSDVFMERVLEFILPGFKNVCACLLSEVVGDS